MTNEIKMHLWVSNMDAVGLDFDGTDMYLDDAKAKEIIARHDGVALDGQTLIGIDPDSIWGTFVALRAAVAEAGHGDVELEEGEVLPEPELVTSLSGSKGAARGLEQLVSGRAKTWSEFRTEALVTDEYIAELIGA